MKYIIEVLHDTILEREEDEELQAENTFFIENTPKSDEDSEEKKEKDRLNIYKNHSTLSSNSATRYRIPKHNMRDIIVTGENEERFVLSEICSREREERLLEATLAEYAKCSYPTAILLLGAGSGIMQQRLEEKGIAYAVLDIEKIEDRIQGSYEIDLDEDELQHSVQSSIFRWQILNKGMAVIPILHPFHRKICKEYSVMAQIFRNNVKGTLWQEMKARPLFEKTRPARILIIPDYYCMTLNITNAAQILGMEVRSVLLTDDKITEKWYSQFLKTAIDFLPDFILTFNHLGISEHNKNVISNVAESLGIPIASWFVDSPDMLIGYEKHDIQSITHIFSWEKSRVEQITQLGYSASYLPLAGDPVTFHPIRIDTIPKKLKKYRSKALFVGAVGVNQGNKLLNRNIFPYSLLCAMPELSAEYIASPIIGVKDFLEKKHIKEYEAMSLKHQKGYVLYLFFYMHTQRRVENILNLLQDIPLTIAGEEGWDAVLPPNIAKTVLPVVDYVKELSTVYQLADININITSPQMKHAVNQRVFDIPLSEAFILTDYQPALEDLFEIGKEIIAYTSMEELKELYHFYIKKPKARKEIVIAGRKRVLREHQYKHRLEELVRVMKERFGV